MQMGDVGYGVVLLAVFFDIWYKDYRGRRIERKLCGFGDSIGASLERFELNIRTEIRTEINLLRDEIRAGINLIRSDIKEFNRTLGHPPTRPIQ